MERSQFKTLTVLTIFPFLITGIERILIKPSLSPFSLPDTSIQLIKVGTVTLLLFSFSAYRANSYGMQVHQKLRKVVGGMFVALIGISYFLLFSLRAKGLFDALAVLHLVNWIITVFREEFILRGIIQTESASVLKGSFLRISNSIWLTTIIFSLWHLVNLTVWPWPVVAIQMLSSIPSGIILGLIREKSGSTVLTYLLHICGDLLSFSLYLLLFGKLFFTMF